ncbi:hypothetical protein [Streptomyces sp. NBC_01445]|uniref:hypothetical protein n=1 Tax=Streptomyces sp. NBC_01445 TaxID=2903869 RepID=UPI002DDB50B4|nr:hypothetical protein [Streptomyces sp. NBC_01445]WSE11452.1 hypothetical protein OG574_50570 [Streptomyces sp. NBC_01445]
MTFLFDDPQFEVVEFARRIKVFLYDEVNCVQKAFLEPASQVRVPAEVNGPTWPCSRIATANGHVAPCDCPGARFPWLGASLS